MPDVGFRKWLGLTYAEMDDDRAVVSLDLDGNGEYDIDTGIDVVRSGSRTQVVRCDVRTDSGEVCATALGTFITRRAHANDRQAEAEGG